jgi:hypothetical protein
VFPVRSEIGFYILFKLIHQQQHVALLLDIREIEVKRNAVPLLNKYVGVLISLWLFLFPPFLFAAQPKEFFLDGLKRLEQRSHKCVELRGEYVE